MTLAANMNEKCNHVGKITEKFTKKSDKKIKIKMMISPH